MGEKTLTMTFLNETGEKVNISIAGVKEGITEAQVKICMDTIIAKNIFFSKGGDLKTANAAQITTRTVDKLSIL